MKKLFTFLITVFLASQSFGQIAAWNTFSITTSDYGASPYAATTLDANLTSIGLTRASGLTVTGTGATKVWGANGYAATTLQNAIDSSKFITFSITTKSGFTASLSYMDSLRVRISSSGPISILVQYSKDSILFTNLKILSVTRPSTTTNFILDSINLSGISSLQNIGALAKVYFRIIPYSAGSTTGTFYIGSNATSTNDVAIYGTVSAVLPVTLKLLSASLINNQPQLNWQTSTEINFDYFGVEKSVDAKNFAEVAKVASNKASNGSNYQFSDVDKTLSNQFYRLRLVNNDGTFKYSSVIAVNGKASISLTLYPNPVTNTIILSHPKAIVGAAIKVTGIDGRILSTQNVQTGAIQTSIDAARLVQGNYVVSFINDGIATTTQLVKQ